MRPTITLSNPLLQNAKKYAAERGMTLSMLIEDALRCRLAQIAPRSTPEFRLHTFRGMLVTPGLDLDRTSALLATDDEEHFLHANARR